MERQLKRTYSEVYSLLQMLGDGFINKVPKHLYTLLQEEKLEEYNPQYFLDIPLGDQNIKKESLSMIALFHSTFWCDTVEEKEELNNLFDKIKEEKDKKIYEASIQELKEEGDVEEITEEIQEENPIENIELKVKKESVFVKIFNKIKAFFSKK